MKATFTCSIHADICPCIHVCAHLCTYTCTYATHSHTHNTYPLTTMYAHIHIYTHEPPTYTL